ncbi:putative alpha/beta hydrolase domain-containing protein [Colletotrichum asianum]
MTPLTNVAKLARAVDRLGRDTHMPEKNSQLYREHGDQHQTYVGLVRQIVYYSSGIGGQTALNIERGFSGLTGKGLTSNILNAYCFICNNFNFASNSDEIILAGFSRGAFTVRCLANFIDKVGLLRRKGLPFLRTLLKLWKKWGRADGDKKVRLGRDLEQKLVALAELRSMAKIKILAEWDSVSAIGSPIRLWPERFSFVNDEVPGSVENAIFALLINAHL